MRNWLRLFALVGSLPDERLRKRLSDLPYGIRNFALTSIWTRRSMRSMDGFTTGSLSDQGPSPPPVCEKYFSLYTFQHPHSWAPRKSKGSITRNYRCYD